ncbi:MAG: hypothetical protein ACI8W8_001965 [Rhodothermales bacterium]|jgi:hypothetical protein
MFAENCMMPIIYQKLRIWAKNVRDNLLLIGMKTIFFSFVLLAGTVAADISFNRDIRPILSENCFHCHGPAKEGRKAKLRLDLPEGAFAAHDGAAAIVPGKPHDSIAMHRIHSTEPDEIMPPSDSIFALSDAQKSLLERWIAEGAEYEGHWAFELPVAGATGAIPEVIDAEIAKTLTPVGLAPAPLANRETLIRRLSLDLRGLPPSLPEVDAFLADQSPAAWESLVDRLLASPQTAERLALDWLDVARYADTNGYSIDDHRDMWVWRDWAIHAFKQNKPYDAFIVEQLAGDLLPDATDEQKMATGFLRNGMNTHEGGTIAEEYRVAYLADKVDTVASTFMGLTVKCAQCHDHKYDPISQKDYYRFYAFFDAATERGKGAKNGNTAPVISVASPLGVGTRDAIAARLERVRELRNNLGKLEAEADRYAAWEAETLAKTAENPRAASFRLPEAKPHWIWADKTGDNAHIQLQTTITVDKALTSAQVYFTCDNNADLHVNGVKVAHVDPWMEPARVDISAQLKSGKNTLLADARNEGGVAAFIAWVQLDFADGETRHVLTDTSWQWRTPQKEDWNAPVSLGLHGVAPWNTLKMPNSVSPRGSILRKAPEDRSPAEQRQVADEFAKSASPLTKRFVKALGIEEDVLEKQLKDRTTVMVMDNPATRKTRILMRGQYDDPGEEVQAGVPSIFSQLAEDGPKNRLHLARWLVSDSNPLTARVAVNRYWQLLFGAGLVRTAEDFGSQGEWPSHPALLDSLAVRFRESGWNLRELLKGIVLSRSYRQQSQISPQLQEADPYNRLLARAPRQRLQAELVRDNAFAIAGILDTAIGGPSVYPAQPDGLWRQVSHFGYGAFTAQAYFPDAGERARRRSMYSFWKRTAPPPGMAIFDAPTRETCTVRRLNTNTPLQALVLLNDPQYLDAARALAGRMLSEGGDSIDNRIRYAFRLATARPPTADEARLLHAAFDRELARFQADPTAAAELLRTPQPTPERAAYAMLASTILNLNETITKQ